MKKEFGLQVHNKYHLELRDAKSGKLKNEAWAYNVVVDNYYTKLAQGSSCGFGVISVGTGTGTPSGTDTGLFHEIATKRSTSTTPIHRIDATHASQQYSVTFSESEANGNLTEVGMSGSSNNYSSHFSSHALFTDSENNPITIIKTDTDRLTVTATVYAEVAYDNDYTYEKNWVDYSDFCSVHSADAATPEQPSSSSDTSCVPWLIKVAFGTGPANFNCYMLKAKDACNQLASRYLNMSYSVQSGVIRFSRGRVLSTEWNDSVTYQIYGFCATNAFLINLPNHDIFAPINLEIERIADGTQTDFNFGIPELMDEVEVYVDNVLQPANTYTWNGKDFTFRQAWVSQHGSYLVEEPTPYYSSGTGDVGIIIGSQLNTYGHWPVGLDKYWVYDFGQPKTVNAFRNTGSSGSVTLEYSSDRENWTLAATIQHTQSNTTVTNEFSPITARYWRVARSNSLPTSESLTYFKMAFDEMKPQLVLDSAPPANSVVKIKAKSEYPIKNSNWIIDQMLFDYGIVRGGQ